MLQCVDAHTHLWDLSRGDYGWLDIQNADLAPIARNFDIHEARAHFERAGIKGCVLVQAAPTDAETDYLLSLADQNDAICGVVGWVDLSNPAAAERIATLAKNPKFKGVRPMLQDIEDVNWITTKPRADAIQALIDANLTFDALVLPKHLAALLEFAAAYPDLPIVIDHAAKPALTAHPSDPRQGMWREGMQRLGAETTALCKISGLLTELNPNQRNDGAQHLQPVVDDVLKWFGPERVMWGSDWPVLELAGSYQGWSKLSKELFNGLSAAQLNALFATTAIGFYGLEDAV